MYISLYALSCSRVAPSCSPLLPLAPLLLPSKRPCSLSRSKRVIHECKFGAYIIYIYICPEPALIRDTLLTHTSPLCSRANDYLGHLLALCSLMLSLCSLLLLHAPPPCSSSASLCSLVASFCRCYLGTFNDG